eukprot:COSAG01_NODE_8441_length_2783_cov_1.202607_2_plen_68_part_00
MGSRRINSAARGAQVDEGVGNVTGALRERQMWDDVFFIVTTDNVCTPPVHRAYALQRRGCINSLSCF